MKQGKSGVETQSQHERVCVAERECMCVCDYLCVIACLCVCVCCYVRVTVRDVNGAHWIAYGKQQLHHIYCHETHAVALILNVFRSTWLMCTSRHTM